MKNKKNVFKNNKWNLAIIILGLIAINIIASFCILESISLVKKDILSLQLLKMC